MNDGSDRRSGRPPRVPALPGAHARRRQAREGRRMKHIDSIIECKGALILGAGVAGLFTALKLSPFPALVLAGARPGVSDRAPGRRGGIAAAVRSGRYLASSCARHDRGGCRTLSS